MVLYKKESLDLLRQKIDLADVLGSHIELKRAGASYKALCPFHDEKSPSFSIQRGDSHYHCFGCGAHGDAIQFLMTHVRMSFTEAVESLAERFQVPLEQTEHAEGRGPNKKRLIECLETACAFYHFLLQHTEEGHSALQYLYHRGIDQNFIKNYRLGLAPKTSFVFLEYMGKQGFNEEELLNAGLIAESKQGGWRPFFYDRITVPIHNAAGAIIGFSARKFREETFGGKYVNTSETPLFKKSYVLFGLHLCRRRIAKERKAIIVEGQFDALRMIEDGLNITVAGQGTAFGEGHVRELLSLGVQEVYLALDPDKAGQEAAYKIGRLFQKEGVEVRIVKLPVGQDPDLFIREKGPEAFLTLCEKAFDYLSFLCAHFSRNLDVNTPAGKHELVRQLVSEIRSWDNPLMEHESLKNLSKKLQIPEDLVGASHPYVTQTYIKRTDYAGLQEVDPNRVLEADLLRWLMLKGASAPDWIQTTRAYLKADDFLSKPCQQLFHLIFQAYDRNEPIDLISLAPHLTDEDGQRLLSELYHRKVNLEKGQEYFLQALKAVLERNWMLKRHEINTRLQSGACTPEEELVLLKQFSEIEKNRPHIQMQEAAR